MTTPRRAPALALGGLLVAALAVLTAAGLSGTLTYYRTPTQLADDPPRAGQHIRLGGEVVPGSLRESDGLITFRLTDGRRQVEVEQHGAPPGTFREGQQAVVEGVLGNAGVFESNTVMVKHSNEYRPADSG